MSPKVLEKNCPVSEELNLGKNQQGAQLCFFN